ncbi:cation:proton antiporter [Kamptonema cortianum]|nr:cation:proton antiporter [Kamptonema cortianum]
MDSGWQLVFQILVALSAAMLLGLLFERMRLSAIIGYLLAGAIAGALGLVGHGHELHVIAEIGVAMLLFTIGLEFSFSELRRMGVRMLIGGVTAILASIAVMSGIALAFGVSPNAAILLGCAGALSSTAVVLRILRDKNDLDSKHGRTALGVLILQDVAIVPLVLVAELMASPGKSIASQLTLALGAAVFLVLVLVVFVSKIVPRLLPEQVVAKNRELPIILAVVTCIGATWAAHHLKLSPALGGVFLRACF